jgi:hypothetical protein
MAEAISVSTLKPTIGAPPAKGLAKDPTKDPSRGVMQMPKLPHTEYLKLSANVLTILGSVIPVLDVPRLEKPFHSDIDIIVAMSKPALLPLLKQLFPDAKSSVNGTCCSMVILGAQVDFITVEHPGMGALFYTNSFSLPMCFLMRGTPFIFTSTSLSLRTRFGTNFVLSQDPERVCVFLGITLEALRAVKNADELFVLLRSSWLYDSQTILSVSPDEKDMSRDMMMDCRTFCKANPATANVPSEDKAISFFGRQEAYQAFVAEEMEKAEKKALSKERESKQALVKKQISEQITDRNLKGKEVGIMFDAFKAWIVSTKGITYEEWAQTNPNVVETFQEFNPRAPSSKKP